MLKYKMEGPKKKKQLTQTQLDQLAKAREKANAVRKRNAEMKKKEKKLKELQRQVLEEELDEDLKRYEKPEEVIEFDEEPDVEEPPTPRPKPKPKKPKPKKPKPVKKQQVESESSGEDSSSSSEEEEPSPPPMRQPKKKRRSKQRHSTSEWDMKGAYNHQMDRAFSSLFPNYNV